MAPSLGSGLGDILKPKPPVPQKPIIRSVFTAEEQAQARARPGAVISRDYSTDIANFLNIGAAAPEGPQTPRPGAVLGRESGTALGNFFNLGRAAPTGPQTPRPGAVLGRQVSITPRPTALQLQGQRYSAYAAQYGSERPRSIANRGGYQEAPGDVAPVSQTVLNNFREVQRKTNLGLNKSLSQVELADAARYTGQAIFNYGERPNVISTDVALQLPFKPASDMLKAQFQEAFGVDGFDNAQDFLGALGYIYEGDGKWRRLDPVSVTGKAGSYTSSYGRRGGGGSGGGYARSSSGNGMTNWRIHL